MTAPANALPPGWWLPFAMAALAWNLMAVLGALASHADASHAAVHPSFALTLLGFVLQYLPLSLLSLILARHAQGKPSTAWFVALLVCVPLLATWQGALDGAMRGRDLGSPWTMLAQQSLLTWWFDFLLLLITFGAHLAYRTWRHTHWQTLAGQRAQQDNLALRLRLLQGQLEPYFLASSLAGIGQLIRSGQREQATRALVRLSDLLRHALRSSRADWQSMADEIQFLRDYIALHGLCHEAGAPVDWQLDPCDWTDYRCPPLLLFPIIEQAASTAPQPISIAIGRSGGQLHIKVRCAQLTGRGAADMLAALRARLAMLFADAAALEVGHEGALTQIRLAYPEAQHAH
ncbi:MAG: histidine kinase [Pseudomonadota bacterium]